MMNLYSHIGIVSSHKDLKVTNNIWSVGYMYRAENSLDIDLRTTSTVTGDRDVSIKQTENNSLQRTKL